MANYKLKRMPEEPRKPLERFFYKLTHRPTAVFMLTLALLSMSVIAAQRIQLDLIPKGISSNDFSIRASWENANPSEIEQKIIKPLEKELRSVSKVESIYSEAEEGVLGAPEAGGGARGGRLRHHEDLRVGPLPEKGQEGLSMPEPESLEGQLRGGR